MEELDFLWLEEPMHEYKQHQYQRRCAELQRLVMSNETLMGDLGISTQWLISGATDLLRANARFGTTQVLKMGCTVLQQGKPSRNSSSHSSAPP